MQQEQVSVTELERQRAEWVAGHVADYIGSGGVRGHIVDFTPIGGYPFSTTLLLRTIGRKSGQLRVTALTYGTIDGKVIVIGSKAGADVHPAWYLNLGETGTVDFQIGGQAFRARWHEAQGPERADLWAFMERLYPPYRDYQSGTSRQIPLVVLEPVEEIATFEA